MSKKKKSIYLIGFMGVGKSSLARKLASKLGIKYIDTDIYIEQKYHAPVSDIIYSSGIDAFRKIEQQALKEIINFDNCIIATGGGLPCCFNNMELINKNAHSIYLKYPVDVIFYRLKRAKTIRPLVKGLNDEELMYFIIKTLAEREPYYSMADYTHVRRSVRTSELLEIIYEMLTFSNK